MPPIRGLLLVAATLALAASANAQIMLAKPERRGQPPSHGPRERLFISPSGEPFRGGDGLAVWFAQADANHDGVVTLPEFQADAARFFKVLDANHDGVIDGFETQAYEQTIAPEIARMDFGFTPGRGEGRRGGGMRGHRRGASPDHADESAQGSGEVGVRRASGVGREGAARWSLINEPEPVAQADENVDSRITQSEWAHATLRRFEVLDKDKTGRLTLSELRARLPERKGGK